MSPGTPQRHVGGSLALLSELLLIGPRGGLLSSLPWPPPLPPVAGKAQLRSHGRPLSSDQASATQPRVGFLTRKRAWERVRAQCTCPHGRISRPPPRGARPLCAPPAPSTTHSAACNSSGTQLPANPHLTELRGSEAEGSGGVHAPALPSPSMQDWKEVELWVWPRRQRDVDARNPAGRSDPCTCPRCAGRVRGDTRRAHPSHHQHSQANTVLGDKRPKREPPAHVCCCQSR